MRCGIVAVVFLVVTGWFSVAFAQQSAWVQITAKPTQRAAEASAASYAADLDHVNGFSLRSGWYAVVLGPFDAVQANRALVQLRATGQIPSDSYIVDGRAFVQHFWVAENAPAATTQGAQTPQVIDLVAGEETASRARASERLLTRERRELLQTALKWEGFYRGAIDGAIGPGTRRSMADYQQLQGFEPTGVLTRLQRRDLVTRYQDVLASVGMTRIIEEIMGIDVEMPTSMVRFDRYQPPFAHFDKTGDSGAQILLISQAGDRDTLRSLFAVMQTLAIVPLDGARKLNRRSFSISGENSEITSYTYAVLHDGHVKGFTVVWPVGPDRRRTLVIDRMQASFTPFSDAVLADDHGATGAQSVDLLSGLEIRRPEFSRTGFYVDTSGLVLTASAGLANCGRVTLDDDVVAEVAANDGSLSLLQPSVALAPLAVARLAGSQPRLNSEIAVSGYSFGGALGAPTMSFGTIADVRGLQGEPHLSRLAIATTPGDTGGPVMTNDGAVVGLLLPDDTRGQILPADVQLAANSATISDFLQSNGAVAQLSDAALSMAPLDLAALGADMSVLVSCWR